jgi:hypothetical protein
VYLKGIHFYTPFFDFVYFYLAVPAFCFFCSAFVVTALCTLFRFQGILPLRDKSAWLIGLVLLCYLVFVAAGVLGWVLPVLFGSAFCVVYVLFGVFFAFAFYQEVRL